MEKIKNIFNSLLAIFKKIGAVRIVAVLLVAVLVYQAVTIGMLCGVTLRWERLSNSVQADEIIIKDLSSEQHTAWLKNTAQDDYLKTDTANLHAYTLTVSGNSHSYVLMCHPATCSSSDMAQYAYHFYDLGFNIVLPDARGCGQSEGNFSFGVTDSKDIPLWIEKIIGKDPDAVIFLFGVGMGGSSVLKATSEGLPENVKGVVEDSGYGNLKDVFKHNINELYNKHAFPTIAVANLYAKTAKGWNFNDGNVEDCIEKIKIPVLFIHGGDDKIVPVAQSNDMFERCTPRGSDHLYVNGAAHCLTMHTDSEKYWREVDKFILENM